jgi:hypothetical protein
MQEAFGIVLFAVVGIGVVVAIVSLFTRGRLYDDIGRGGMSIGEDREARPRADARPRAPAGPAAIDLAERDDEIRQMLAARNARRAARGQEPVDVEQELRSLTHEQAAADPEIAQEVRALVEARNARRVARGEEALDVEAEIARQLRGLPE